MATAPHSCLSKSSSKSLENLLPTPELNLPAWALATEAGAAFAVTCTGFHEGGATKEDVQSMKVAVEGYSWEEEGGKLL
jgi:deoxyribose-phosphate aldolase